MLHDKPRRRQFTLQQRAEAETRGHVREGGEQLRVGVGDTYAFELQIDLTGSPIDAETRVLNRDLHTTGGPVHELLDIRGQPVEIDRPLHQ